VGEGGGAAAGGRDSDRAAIGEPAVGAIGEPAIRALLRGALAAADGNSRVALRLAVTAAAREPGLSGAIHGRLGSGIWGRLVREELLHAGGSTPAGC
jgi:hypothetical protein